MTDALIFILLSVIVIINLFVLAGFFGFFSGAVSGAPFVPSGNKTVQKMVAFADIQPNQTVYDLGCGDGRIVFAAAKKGAHATGVEISFLVYIGAKIRQKLYAEKGNIIYGSLWDQDIHDADVIFVYLLPPMMKRFAEEKVRTLKKGTLIISHGFKLPGYTPKETINRDGFQGKILKYVV